MRYFFLTLPILIVFNACHQNKSNEEKKSIEETIAENNIVKEEKQETDTIIIDSRFTFTEAIEGANAPQNIIDELELIDVTYISTDSKLHKGQILTNKRLVADIKEIFELMLEQEFVIERAIPIVAYNWSDSLSMANNNTYSFCYRNTSYSLHAKGMAIDINPRFNPLRWKIENRSNQPLGAVLDTTVNGTLHPNHPIVEEFSKRGFRWGHYFSKYWDDHHFDKK